MLWLNFGLELQIFSQGHRTPIFSPSPAASWAPAAPAPAAPPAARPPSSRPPGPPDATPTPGERRGPPRGGGERAALVFSKRQAC